MKWDELSLQEIMVVKLRALGDVLTTFPLLRALKERFPQAKLTMVADETYASLFEHHPRVDAFWPHPARALRQRGSLAQLQHHFRMVNGIRQKKVDLYIDLYGSLRTALWGALAGVPRRMGFNLRGRRYFYHDRIVAQHRYVVAMNLQFAQALGWTGNNQQLEFFLSKEEHRQAMAKLKTLGWDSHRPYVIISPGGGWPLKCWAPEKFGAVGQRLARETGCQIVLSGTAAETGLIEACAAAMAQPVVKMIDWPLRQAAAVISGAALFIGNDSGPKYFAEAFKVPTLICYGPTDFVNNNPKSPFHVPVYRDVPCRPCHQEQCSQSTRQCLDDLTVEDVLSKAFELWKLKRVR